MQHLDPPIPLGTHAQQMWAAHRTMRQSTAATTLLELAEICEAYSLALEVVALAASRTMDTPAKSDPTASRVEAILNNYIVGLTLVEHAVLSGYNVQSAALVRQELEAIAALEELRLGRRKEGKTPNVCNIPSIPGSAYGHLSKIAHFADTAALQLLGMISDPQLNGQPNTENWLLSPQHIPNTTKQLFALHTFLMLHFAQFQAAHYSERHGSSPSEAEISALARSHEILTTSGVLGDA